MYDELVERLRDSEHQIDCCLCDRDCCYQDGKVHGKCIIIEAADAIEELMRRCEQFQYMPPPAWIPVTEKLPEMNTSCLLYNKYYGPMVGARIDDMRFRIPGSRFPDTPTHWMPLPEPPKEE